MENDQMNQITDRSGIKKRMMMTAVITLGIVILVVIGVIVFAKGEGSTSKLFPKLTKDSLPQKDEDSADSMLTGTLGLQLKGTKQVFSKGNEVTLFIYANGGDAEITEFDARLMYATDALKYVSMRPLLDGMESWGNELPLADDSDQNDATQEVLIIGTQDLDRSEPYIFKDTAVAEVVFEVLDDSEDIPITFLFKPHQQDDSNLMTTSLVDILGKTQGITISVNK